MKVIIRINKSGNFDIIQKDKGVDVHILDYSIKPYSDQAPFTYHYAHDDDEIKIRKEVDLAIKDIQQYYT
jgi:hypothetical protein